jgi:triosephosphate isomerase
MARGRKLIAGNWKMNGLHADGVALAEAIAAWAKAGSPRCDLLVCPPATIAAAVGTALAGSGVALGGQNCHALEKGACTGDVSAEMLKDAGCAYVIVGHSERRACGESDAAVNAKVAAAWRAKLVAILCVGETRAEREAGREVAVVAGQLAGSIPHGATSGNLVIAYEPVWAIGTGKVATPEIAADAHRCIRDQIRKKFGPEAAVACRILYGGSVKPDNIRGLMAQPEIDGALVGGASLEAISFASIVNF